MEERTRKDPTGSCCNISKDISLENWKEIVNFKRKEVGRKKEGRVTYWCRPGTMGRIWAELPLQRWSLNCPFWRAALAGIRSQTTMTSGCIHCKKRRRCFAALPTGGVCIRLGWAPDADGSACWLHYRRSWWWAVWRHPYCTCWSPWPSDCSLTNTGESCRATASSVKRNSVKMGRPQLYNHRSITQDEVGLADGCDDDVADMVFKASPTKLCSSLACEKEKEKRLFFLEKRCVGAIRCSSSSHEFSL